MPFYYFGPDESSWARGNERFAEAENLPPTHQAAWDELGEPFREKDMAGTRIRWMSTGPDGSYAIMTKNGQLLSNRDDLLKGIKGDKDKIDGNSITYISLSPLGGWLVSYADSTAQISGRFSEAFSKLVAVHIDLSLPAGQRQPSGLQAAFFGANEAIIIKAIASFDWDNVSPALSDILQGLRPSSFVANQSPIGFGTALCPWSPDFYFLETIPMQGGRTKFVHNIPPGSISPGLMESLLKNRLPPSDTSAPDPETAMKEQQQQPPFTIPNTDIPAHQQPWNEPPPPIPDSNTPEYQQLWNDAVGSGSLIDGNTAAPVFLRSGLDQPTLEEIWQHLDQDKDGKLNQDEFFKALELIKTRLATHPPAVRWTDGGVSCDICSVSISAGAECYYCDVCKGGDFDLCSNCYQDPSKRCEHNLRLLRVQQRCPGGQQRDAIRWADAGLLCDGCGAGISIGDACYYCSVCQGGDFDLCTRCYEDDASARRCPHGVLDKNRVTLRLEAGARPVPGMHASCDGCGAALYEGTLVYCCPSCNAGDFDICEACWRSNRVCGHPLTVCRIAANSGEVSWAA